MMDDGELLRRYAQDRSEAAFTELVRRYLDLVYSTAWRQVGDPHGAQEVAQAVFADLARKAPSLSRHTALLGWLYTSTHFAAAKMRRTEQRRRTREQEAHVMQELLASSESAVDWERLRPVLDAAMHELNRRDREAVLLRFFENRSFGEVGRMLGLGENAARMQVERALDKLGGLLARHGVTSTASALSVILAGRAVAAVPVGMVQTVAAGALGQAAASAGILAVTIQFMSATKFTLGATGIAGLLALSATVFYTTQTSRAADELASLEQDSAALRSRLRDLNGATGAPPTIRPSAPPSVAAPAPPESVNEQIIRDMMSDPEMIRLRVRQRTAEMGRRLGPFYQNAGFSAAQMAQFEEQIFGTLERMQRAQADWRIKGNEVSFDSTVNEQLQRIRGGFEQEIRGTFGEKALQQFKEFEHLGEARNIAGELAAKVFFTDTPLAPTQAAELQRILAANSLTYAHGESLSRGDLNWDHVLEQTHVMLSSEQQRALESIRNDAELDAKINEALFPETPRTAR